MVRAKRPAYTPHPPVRSTRWRPHQDEPQPEPDENIVTHVTSDLSQPPQITDQTKEGFFLGMETEGGSSKQGESKAESPKVSESVVDTLDKE